jgi:hypothetical protein
VTDVSAQVIGGFRADADCVDAPVDGNQLARRVAAR